MICVEVLTGNNYVRRDNPNPDGTCPAMLLVNQNEFDSSYSQVTPAEIGIDITFGFGVVMLFWSLGYAIGVAKQAISKL